LELEDVERVTLLEREALQEIDGVRESGETLEAERSDPRGCPLIDQEGDLDFRVLVAAL
jgi:hypothetical protein